MKWFSVEEIESALQGGKRTAWGNLALLAFSLLAFITVERTGVSLEATGLLVAVIGK